MSLAIDHVRFEYTAGRPVLADVGLVAPAGSVTALVGPNGAGKSTLVKIMAGVLDPSEGRVALAGEPIRNLTAHHRARCIGYVPQKSLVAFPFSVRQVVRMGRYAVGENEAEVSAALARVGLPDREHEPFGVLSAGQQQRATLARVLAQIGCGGERPAAAGKVVLADEPVSAMDPRHAIEAMDLLRSLAGAGAAVVVVLHDLTLAARFADRAALLGEDGRIAAAGPTDQALAPDVLRRVFGVSFVRLEGPAGGVIVPGAVGGGAAAR